MDELAVLVHLRPRRIAAFFGDAEKRRKEGTTDVLSEGKVFLPITRVQIIVENPPTPRARPRCGM